MLCGSLLTDCLGDDLKARFCVVAAGKSEQTAVTSGAAPSASPSKKKKLAQQYGREPCSLAIDDFVYVIATYIWERCTLNGRIPFRYDGNMVSTAGSGDKTAAAAVERERRRDESGAPDPQPDSISGSRRLSSAVLDNGGGDSDDMMRQQGLLQDTVHSTAGLVDEDEMMREPTLTWTETVVADDLKVLQSFEVSAPSPPRKQGTGKKELQHSPTKGTRSSGGGGSGHDGGKLALFHHSEILPHRSDDVMAAYHGGSSAGRKKKKSIATNRRDDPVARFFDSQRRTIIRNKNEIHASSEQKALTVQPGGAQGAAPPQQQERLQREGSAKAGGVVAFAEGELFPPSKSNVKKPPSPIASSKPTPLSVSSLLKPEDQTTHPTGTPAAPKSSMMLQEQDGVEDDYDDGGEDDYDLEAAAADEKQQQLRLQEAELVEREAANELETCNFLQLKADLYVVFRDIDFNNDGMVSWDELVDFIVQERIESVQQIEKQFSTRFQPSQSIRFNPALREAGGGGGAGGVMQQSGLSFGGTMSGTLGSNPAAAGTGVSSASALGLENSLAGLKPKRPSSAASGGAFAAHQRRQSALAGQRIPLSVFGISGVFRDSKGLPVLPMEPLTSLRYNPSARRYVGIGRQAVWVMEHKTFGVCGVLSECPSAAVSADVTVQGTDSQMLASSHRDNSLRVWRVREATATGAHLIDGAVRAEIQQYYFSAEYEHVTVAQQTVLRWSPSVPDFLISGGADGDVSTWRLNFDILAAYRRGESNAHEVISVSQWPGHGGLNAWHSDVVSDACWIPHRQLHVATCSRDATINLYDLEKDKRLRAPIVHNKGLYTMCYNDYTNTLVSGGFEFDPYCWDLGARARHPVRLSDNKNAHEHAIISVESVPNAPLVCSCDCSGKVKVWDLRMFGCVQTMTTERFRSAAARRQAYSTANAMTITPSGALYISGSSFTKMDPADETDPLHCYTSDVVALAFDDQLGRILTAHADAVVLWSSEGTIITAHPYKPGEKLAPFADGAPETVRCLSVPPGGSKYYLGSSFGRVTLHQMSSGALVKDSGRIHQAEVKDLCYGFHVNDYEYCISLAADGSCAVTTESHRLPSSFRIFNAVPLSLCWDFNTKLLYMGTQEGEVIVADPYSVLSKGPNVREQISAGGAEITAITTASAGEGYPAIVVAGTVTGKILLWRAGEGKACAVMDIREARGSDVDAAVTALGTSLKDPRGEEEKQSQFGKSRRYSSAFDARHMAGSPQRGASPLSLGSSTEFGSPLSPGNDSGVLHRVFAADALGRLHIIAVEGAQQRKPKLEHLASYKQHSSEGICALMPILIAETIVTAGLDQRVRLLSTKDGSDNGFLCHGRGSATTQWPNGVEPVFHFPLQRQWLARRRRKAGKSVILIYRFLKQLKLRVQSKHKATVHQKLGKVLASTADASTGDTADVEAAPLVASSRTMMGPPPTAVVPAGMKGEDAGKIAPTNLHVSPSLVALWPMLVIPTGGSPSAVTIKTPGMESELTSEEEPEKKSPSAAEEEKPVSLDIGGEGGRGGDGHRHHRVESELEGVDLASAGSAEDESSLRLRTAQARLRTRYTAPAQPPVQQRQAQSSRQVRGSTSGATTTATPTATTARASLPRASIARPPKGPPPNTGVNSIGLQVPRAPHSLTASRMSGAQAKETTSTAKQIDLVPSVLTPKQVSVAKEVCEASGQLLILSATTEVHKAVECSPRKVFPSMERDYMVREDSLRTKKRLQEVEFQYRHSVSHEGRKKHNVASKQLSVIREQEQEKARRLKEEKEKRLAGPPAPPFPRSMRARR